MVATATFVAIVGVLLAGGYVFTRSYFPNVLSMVKFFAFAGKDGRELQCLNYVKTHAPKGDAEGVLKAIDKFGWTQDWLMNVGDDKGEVLSDEVRKKQPKNALEIGAYVGYSAVRIGSLLPEGGHLTSVELNPANAAITRQMVDYAGLSHKVTIVDGTVPTVLKDFMTAKGLGQFDFVFIDHWKDAYLPDLNYLLEHKLVQQHGIIVADNILFPGAPDYRQFVNTDPRFKSVEHKRHLEYSQMEDIIMVSELLTE